MAKTLGNLRTGVRVYLDEANQADFLDSEVLRSINYAYHEVASKVVQVYEDFFNTTTPKFISTIANQQEYTLDSTIVKVRRVEINYNPSNPNSVAQRATPIKTDEMPLAVSNNALGGTGLFSAGYYINGNQGTQIIGFTPVPPNTGTNNVSVWGIIMPSDLSADGDTISIPYPDLYAQLIELRAAALLLRKGQQAENYAGQYRKDFDLGVIEMQNFLKERQTDGVWLIGDAIGEDTLFDHNL